MSFNLFSTPTKDDIRVGYVDPTLGFVDGVSVCEANEYAKNNPGTTFIFRDGDNNLRYLNINEVNDINPNDLTATNDECEGIQQYKECGPPRIQFFGGGGVGAAGNPVIGRDGSLLAVDLITGGYGYQYSPIVAAKDDCQFGNGAVLTAVLGETVDETEVFEGEEDFENYELCEDTDVGYGLRYGPNGEELGAWEPQTYTRVGADPIKREIEIFQKAIQKPFWTTRKEQPDRIITVEGETKQYPNTFNVTHPAWGEFMNQYAVSPVKPSNVTGSDESGKVFSLEWELNFPVSGEYIFRGLCDNTSQVYIDGGLVGKLKGFQDNPSPLQKTISEGNHILKIELLNVPITEKTTTTTDSKLKASFIQQGSSFYLQVDGSGSGEISFFMDVDDNPFTAGMSAREISIPSDGGRVILKRDPTKEKDSDKGSGTFSGGKKYGPIEIIGAGPGARGPIINSKTRLGIRDADGDDANIKINIESVKSSRSSSSSINVGEVISPQSWNTNPMGVSMIIDAPLPPIPQEQPPAQTGECPPNPIWSTRFSGSRQTWYPVRFPSWSKFMNRYAISPVLPLNTPGSDISGTTFSNSWEIDLPYAGFYGVKGTRDNNGRILIDGKEVSSLDGFSVDNPKLSKVYLTKGRHTIVAEILNQPISTRSVIDAKVFSTQDWRVPSSPLITKKEVSFKIREAGSDGSSVEIVDLLTVDEKNDGEEISKKIEVGKVYKVVARPSNRKLRSDGRILKLEDSTDNDYNDLVITASDGKFYDINGNTCKFIIENPQSKNGVTYEGPPLFAYNESRWSKYMNDFSVSPKVFESINSPESPVVGKYTLTWKNVNFQYSGSYKFNFQADNVATLKVGGKEIFKTTDFTGEKVQYTFNITSGKYDIVIELENLKSSVERRQDFIFSRNPMGVALFISKDIVFEDDNKTPWTSNPIGISAILIPPPCAKKIGGRGVVDKVIVNDPGNGYLPPREQGPGYPVTLVLDEVIVEDPGINYRCGEDQLQIIPNNGAQLSYDCNPFGKINTVKVLNSGIGFNVYPEITLPSETGVNATFRPVFRVVRDPILPPEQVEKIIQVTDLVGLKQTGYVDGRAYYGAVYYDEGIPFAGYYKTVGPQTRVYATLQESITARVTTRPSAIQRSGTDVTSNDPRLNIPGTIEDTQT